MGSVDKSLPFTVELSPSQSSFEGQHASEGT
jgi:hypothetical protein